MAATTEKWGRDARTSGPVAQGDLTSMSKPNAIGAQHERAVADVADLLGMSPEAVATALRPMRDDGEIIDRHVVEPVPVVKRDSEPRKRTRPRPEPEDRTVPLMQLLAQFRATGFSVIGNAPVSDQDRARKMTCRCGRRGLWTKAAKVPGSESWRTAAYCPNCKNAVEI